MIPLQTIIDAKTTFKRHFEELKKVRQLFRELATDRASAFEAARRSLLSDVARFCLDLVADRFVTLDVLPLDERSLQYFKQVGILMAHVTSRPSEVLREHPRTRVFLVHGHDRLSLRDLQVSLTVRYHFDCVVLMDRPGEGRTLLEKLERQSEGVQFAIVLCTPDDKIEPAEGEPYFQPRPNVLVELGYFAGLLGRHKTCVLLKAGTKLPSDFGGFEYYEFRENIEEKLLKVEDELVAAGLWRRP